VSLVGRLPFLVPRFLQSSSAMPSASPGELSAAAGTWCTSWSPARAWCRTGTRAARPCRTAAPSGRARRSRPPSSASGKQETRAHCRMAGTRSRPCRRP
jgi:hypothetical protein